MPVIALKDTAALPEEIKELVNIYDAWVGDTVFARFMAHCPDIFLKFNEFYGAMLAGKVESEIKELARLRLARLNGCDY
jgi:hypothetical protein